MGRWKGLRFKPQFSVLSLERKGGGGWRQAMVLVCLPLAEPIGLSPLHILTLCGSKRVLVMSREPLDDYFVVGCPRDGLLPVPLTRCIQMHTPSPCEGLPTPAQVSDGVCICRIIFLTEASNNHNDSFPFILCFASFCAVDHFRRARSALPCYLPLCFPLPLSSFL